VSATSTSDWVSKSIVAVALKGTGSPLLGLGVDVEVEKALSTST
jgi:hypothetical protein